MHYNKRLRFIFRAVLLVMLILAFWGIYNSFIHRGEVGVVIRTVPEDARVELNGRQVSSSRIYLKPGSYVFTATMKGFQSTSSEIAVSKSRQYVGLVLSPVSDEALKWAEENQTKFEEVGSRVVQDHALAIEKTNPLLAKLPYDDIMGPFSINFDFASETALKATIIIRNSTPNGRIKALRWIREQGVDPADLMIRFEDFNNPTNQGDI